MCTGLYIGKNVSVNGHAIIARSCDASLYRENTASIRSNPRTTQANRYLECGESDIKYPLPKTTYKYLSMPTFPTVRGSLGIYALNEYGLNCTATIDGYTRPEIRELDPFLKNGICEPIITNIFGASCKSVRESIDLIENIMENFGSALPNIMLMADQKECWIVEFYTGHHWAALKLPEDKVSVFGNGFMLDTEYANVNKEDFRHSKGLFEFIENSGCCVKYDGNISLCRSIRGQYYNNDYSQVRCYMGMKVLAPSTCPDKYNVDTFYPLLYSPDKKVSLKDVFELYRYRYEGSEFCPEETGKDNVRLIASEATYSVHAIEILHDMPAEMSAIAWTCFSNAEHSVFLPYLSMLTKTAKEFCYVDKNSEIYKGKIPIDTEGKEIRYNDKVAQTIFKRLCAIAEENRELYGTNVRKFWSEKEDKLIEKMDEVIGKVYDLYLEDKDKAIDYINSWTIDLQNETVAEANSMFTELVWYIMTRIETFKYLNDNDEKKLIPNNPKPFVPIFCFKDAN